MRIQYLIMHAYGVGGTVRTVTNQANAMAAAGHDVEIVSVLRWRQRHIFPVDRRVAVTTLFDVRADGVPGDGPDPRIPEGEARGPQFTREVVDGVVAALAATRADILVGTRVGLNLLVAEHAPASVVRIGQDHMNFESYRAPLQDAIRAAYPRLDAVVTLTERDRLAYRAALGPGTRTESIPNAVHTLDVPRADPSAKLVVAAGQLGRQKGFDLLIPAFAQVVARHPEWRLRIFGKGRPRRLRILQELVFEHHLYNNVHLMGLTPQLSAEFAKASVFTLSSRREGLPMVLIEAMSQGLAPVVFDCPTGPADVITDGRDGLLVPAEDVDTLAKEICRVIENPGLRASLGARAVETAARYGPEQIIPRWENLFADLMEGR